MSMLTFIDYIRAYGLLFAWRDSIELLFFIATIYWLSRWLAHDKTKPLLAYFYAYSGLIIAAYAIPLPTMYTLLVAAWPCALTIVLFMHQHALQRNFIGLQAHKHIPNIQHDWIKELVRTAIQTTESGRPCAFVIQRTHDLSSLVHTSLPLNVPITQQLLHIIFESSCIHPDNLLWLDSTGCLRGANTTYRTPEGTTILSDDTYRHITWGLAITEHNDALVCSVRPSGTFDVVAQAKVLQDMPAHALIRYLKNYCSQTPEPSLHGTPHENKPSTQTRNP